MKKTFSNVFKKFDVSFGKMDDVFKDFDDAFKDLDSAFKDTEVTSSSSNVTKIYGSTKENLLTEINKYTSKGYTLKEMSMETIGTEKLHMAILVMKVSF